MLHPDTLVIVADGESAVIWRNRGHAVPDLELVERVSFGTMSDEVPSGSTPVEQSWRDLEEATFIKLLVHKLNAMAIANAMPDAVVIIADPTSLGHMRPQYHSELKRRILRELPKTRVKASKPQLEKTLS